MRLGGAKTILATVTSGKAMSGVIPGLAVRGRLSWSASGWTRSRSPHSI